MVECCADNAEDVSSNLTIPIGDYISILFTYHFLFIMSTELMVSALRRGQNGNEILAILNAITGDSDNTPAETVSAQPTLEIVEF